MAGAGFKTFNTGDVLTASDVNTYLMQQTVMVFADASARSTALGANVAEGMISYLKDTNAVERYDGSSWGAIGAGDIEGVTAGAGLSGGGTSGTVTLNLATTAAGRNVIINGGFDVWQRSTSNASFAVNNSSSYVTADRWSIGSTASVNLASSRQTADNATAQYALRFGRVSGATATGVVRAINALETVNSIPLQGKTVTLSFYAKSGANAPTTLTTYVYTGTGTDQAATTTFTGWTGAANTSQANTVSTTSAKFTMTATIPANATQIAVLFDYTSTGTAGANEWMQIEQVQLELGSAATPFSRAGGTIQGELAACQRYYEKSYDTGTAPLTATQTAGIVFINSGNVASASTYGNVIFKVEKRTTPTVTVYSYNNVTAGVVSDNNGGSLAAGSGTSSYIGTRAFSLYNGAATTINAASGGFICHYVASAEL